MVAQTEAVPREAVIRAQQRKRRLIYTTAGVLLFALLVWWILGQMSLKSFWLQTLNGLSFGAVHLPRTSDVQRSCRGRAAYRTGRSKLPTASRMGQTSPLPKRPTPTMAAGLGNRCPHPPRVTSTTARPEVVP